MYHGRNFRFEPRRERLFQKGDFKYVILDLLKEKPSYGYEIMREMEDRFHGFYSPSPGIVYPTLQLLEEMGFVTVSPDNGKKIYTIAEEGLLFLKDKEKITEDIKSQIKNWWNPGIHRELRETMHEAGDLVRLLGRLTRQADKEQLRKVREIIAEARGRVEEALKK